jgi:hypothetical protein
MHFVYNSQSEKLESHRAPSKLAHVIVLLPYYDLAMICCWWPLSRLHGVTNKNPMTGILMDIRKGRENNYKRIH